MTFPVGQVIRFHGRERKERTDHLAAELGERCERIETGAVKITAPVELRPIASAASAGARQPATS